MAAPLATLALKGASALAAAAAGDPKAAREAKARQTAQDFETMFLEQMLDRMVSGAGDEGPLGENGTGGGVYRSMLVKEYAGSIAKSGGIGLTNQIYAEILKMQEGGAHVGRS